MANLTRVPRPILAGSSSYTASCSASTSYCSASTSYSGYDVFIHHLGGDIKRTFSSYLYRSLSNHGLRVFMDEPEPELVLGISIISQKRDAIRGASLHIAILSNRYARSSWCLHELVLMKESGAPILPVFFHVEPSLVRHEEALRMHQEKQRFDPYTIQKWRETLSYVADLSGFELNAFNGDEHELLNKVLHKVLIMVPKPLSYVARYPTGLTDMANLTTISHSNLAGSSSSTASCYVSTSYSKASCSASTSYSEYDVFINHRGPDIKMTFVSHLYRRLHENGLRAFLDKPELEKGQHISSQIADAIGGASVHIAIFSKNYAQSSWCLNELVLMKESGAVILPVFFNVEPSVVRHNDKTGAYAEDLRILQEKQRYDADTIQKWREALSDVADLSGFELKAFNGDECELLDKVLQKVLETLPKPPLDVAEYPTGLGEKLREFENAVLSQHQEEPVKTVVVGIVGVGGVGKTTLAREFFNCRRSCYNKSSFISDVREKAARMSLNSVQSRLLQDLTGNVSDFESTAEGIGILKRRLSSCHALIIVDDVDHADQLNVLLPMKDALSPQSLILVTSRNKQVLRTFGLLEESIYYLRGLNTLHSKELFCSHAFPQSLPPPGFEYLVDLFVAACDGLPLALKVLGALVCGRNDKMYWEELLDRLLRTPPQEIQQRLRISYDQLNQEDQQIFIDVACYFIGEDIELAIKIWGKVGLQHLEDRCLVEVDLNEHEAYQEFGVVKIIKMHDHIRDLGRSIAEDVSMPLRLCYSRTNTIDDLLNRSSRDRINVHGIKGEYMVRTNMYTISEMPWYIRWSDEVLEKCLRHLFYNFGRGGILNLQLVATEDGYLERILRRARSTNLKWLRWYRCPYSCLPSWIPMENLKVLEVEGRELKMLWNCQSQVPLELRELKIYAPLSRFPESIGQLKHLQKIVIHGSNSSIPLESLPEEFCDLHSLKCLLLYYCERMMSLPDSFGKLTNLEHIDLRGACSLRMLPDTFGHLSRLKRLSLWGCSNLTISNGTLGNITTLEYLNLFQVAPQRQLGELSPRGRNIKELPGDIGDLCNLKVMRGGGHLLEGLPPCLGHLKGLNNFSVSYSPKLTRLPDSFGQLTLLKELTVQCCGIEHLPIMNSLERLHIWNCPLREVPWQRVEGETGERALSTDRKCVLSLRYLELLRTKIVEVGFPMGVCPNLQTLRLYRCPELRQVTGLEHLTKLGELRVHSCIEIEELRGVEHVMSLKVLDVWRCPKLQRGRGVLQQQLGRGFDAEEVKDNASVDD